MGITEENGRKGIRKMTHGFCREMQASGGVIVLLHPPLSYNPFHPKILHLRAIRQDTSFKKYTPPSTKNRLVLLFRAVHQNYTKV